MNKTNIQFDDLSCSLKIKSNYPTLGRSSLKIANYILASHDKILNKPISEVAKEIGTSESSIIRFCREIGYSGFSELKLMLAKEIGENNGSILSKIKRESTNNVNELEDLPVYVMEQTIQCLNDSLKILNINEYKKAVMLIHEAENVYFYGVANSSSVAFDAVNKFIRIGIKCNLFLDTHMQMTTAINLTPKDVVIGISHSGMTRDTANVLNIAKKSGAKIISITNYKGSIISEIGDIKLLTANYETDFYSETMVSRISQLAIIDMLYVGVIMMNRDKYMHSINRVNEEMANLTY